MRFEDYLSEDTLYTKEQVPDVGDVVESVREEGYGDNVWIHFIVKFKSGKVLTLAKLKDEKKEEK